MSEAREHPYAGFLHRVRKPARYLGGEHGEIRKPWDSVACRMCLAFPDVYDVGMSHLGTRILYSAINGAPDLLVERAYAAWPDLEHELRASGEPLRSLESWRALRDFDVVGFSLQFELTYTNVLAMLDLGGIPLRSADRGERDPLVLAGGPNVTHAEPIAPFVDAFLLGDGEERTLEILRSWAKSRDAGMSRAERLLALARLGGVYVPSLYETAPDPDTGIEYVARALHDDAPLPVTRAFVANLACHPFPSDGPVPTSETVFDRMSVEIARGCTEGCRFCQAGMIYRPVRERPPEQILDVIEHAVREGGHEGASLTSLSTADYSAIAPLVNTLAGKLAGERVTLSVSSLRAYGLGEDVLDSLKDSGARGLTFAPEAGTQRMRDVVNKNVTEAQLLETAERVFSRGWSRMKLYFMIGLPTEEDEDVRGIVETGARALAVGRRHVGRKATVTVSVSTHVPKPHTPFQWCAMDARDEVLRKQRLLRDAARRTGIDLRLHESGGSWIEGVLARGDRTLADVVERAYRAGARFDSWEEHLRIDAWQTAFQECGVDPSRFLGTFPTSSRLPWDHLDVGLADGFLAREYRRALRHRLSPPCGKPARTFLHHTNLQDHEADRRKFVCYDCGVACDLGAMREERAGFLRSLGALAPAVAAATSALEPVPPAPAPPAHSRYQSVSRESQEGGKTGRLDDSSGEPCFPSSRLPVIKETGNGDAPPARRRHRQPPKRASQGKRVRVRLHYEKLGRAAFGSHLDQVRLLPRLFRRLGLPLFYSEGFHTRPVLTFGPALPLGMPSLAEYLDVALVAAGEIDCDSLPAALSEASIEGLQFLEARVLGDADPKLGRVLDEATYVVGLPQAALEALGCADTAALAALVGARRERGDLRVRREIEGLGRSIDVARSLVHVEVGEGSPALERAGIVGRLVPIELRLRIDNDGSARASEAVQALTGSEDDLPMRCVRVALSCARTGTRSTPMQLEDIRRALASAPVAAVSAAVS